MIKLSHLGSLSILALTAALASTGCASVDSTEDPSADDVADVDGEDDIGEAQDELVYSCTNVSNANWADSWEALEKDVRTEINKKRASGGSCNGVSYPPAAALTNNTKLTCAARSHSKDMGEKNVAATHVGSDGSTESQRVTDAGYAWSKVGENVSGGQTVAANLVTNWLNSADHCSKVLSSAYTNFGVGYYYKSTTTNKTRWTLVVAKPQ